MISACGIAGAPDYAYEPEYMYAYEESIAPGYDMNDEYLYAEAEAANSFNAPSPVQQRIVIMNAELSIVAADPLATMDAIVELAEERGGFVVSSNMYQMQLDSGLEVPRASITIRVPAEDLNDSIAEIEELATQVQSKNVSGQDITREYTDLQSRLRNLEAAEKQLTNIMDSATKTEDVLSIYNQLTRVREEIEVIKGQIKYYEESAALSAISVNITADAAVQPLTIGGWQPVGVAKDAIQALINVLKFFGNALIYIVLLLLPILIILAIPVVILLYFIRFLSRQRKKRKAEKQASQE
jgi:hypothetical protein